MTISSNPPYHARSSVHLGAFGYLRGMTIAAMAVPNPMIIAAIAVRSIAGILALGMVSLASGIRH
jgi:hypothetical protein